MMSIILFIFSILAFFIHLFFTKRLKTKKLIVEILLSYLIFFGLGLEGIISSIAHIFFSHQASAFIGWEGGSPFQFEVGIADLSLGVLAILCMFIRMKHFWLSTIIANSIFLWGAAIGHVRQMIIEKNFFPGNAGIFFYHDVIYPFIIIGLFIWLLKLKKEEKYEKIY